MTPKLAVPAVLLLAALAAAATLAGERAPAAPAAESRVEAAGPAPAPLADSRKCPDNYNHCKTDSCEACCAPEKSANCNGKCGCSDSGGSLLGLLGQILKGILGS
ncbi:MAG: hypothetical protein KBD01_01180 [Acidobacteria bacterium]|nr:hypothetical protein [Acidobacteriota bacterium]